MKPPPIAFVGSAGQAPNSFAGSFPASHGATDSLVGSSGLSGIIDTNAAANEVLETAINGTAVGITAFAAEAGHTIEYTLPVNPGGLFAIGLSSGEVTKAAALDAEAAVSHDITVRATSSSGKVKERVFTIAVNDANEFGIGAITDVDAGANEVLESAANGATVGITAQATDADVSDTVTYSLTNDAGGRFAIDADTGVVTVADTGLIDFETQTSHQIAVRADSSDLSEQDQNFTITVLNDAADDGLVPAVRFDGTSDALRRAANPTGAADGVDGTFAIPIKMMGGDTTLQYIWSNATGSYIRRNADGKVEAQFADAAGVERAKIISTNTLRVADGWTLLLVNPANMYFGNTDETGTHTTGAAANIDWTSGFNWGEDSAAANRGNFELARPWLTLAAYDLTVLGNRQAFYTSLTPLTLADINTDGSGPGVTALDFLSNPYSAFSQNAGSGGNFSVVGGLTVGTGPAGAALTVPSSVNWIAFDTAGGDYLSSIGHGAASDDMMVSVRFRRSRIGVTEFILQSVNSARWEIAIQADDDLQVGWHNNSGALRLLHVGTKISDTDEHHLMFACHNETSTGGVATMEVYLDGVDITNIAASNIGTAQFEPQARNWRICASGSTAGFDGEIAQLWVDNTKYDLTQAAEREKFYNGGPVDLGAGDGSGPGRPRPIVYLPNPAATLGTNGGDSGVNFTVNGTPTNRGDWPIVEGRATFAKTNTNASDNFTLPAGIVSGDRLLLIFTGIVFPTTNPPTGWTLLASYGGSSGAPRTAIYVRDADGTEGASLTLDTSLRGVSISYRISDASPVTEWEITTTTGGPSTAPDPPSENASYGANNTLWIAGATMRDQGVDVTAFPANYFDVQEIGGSGGTSSSAGSAERKLVAAAENPGAFTIGLSKDWGAFTVAVKPAA